MAGTHKRKRETTTSGYARMLERMHRSWAQRVRKDTAAAIDEMRALEASIVAMNNLGIFLALEDGKSPTELAERMGVSRQAIYKRAALGEQIARQQDRHHDADLPRLPRAAPREVTSG